TTPTLRMLDAADPELLNPRARGAKERARVALRDLEQTKLISGEAGRGCRRRRRAVWESGCIWQFSMKRPQALLLCHLLEMQSARILRPYDRTVSHRIAS